MDLLVARLSPILHLTRVTTAFAAVGNVWFVILWSRAAEREQAFAPESLVQAPLWAVLAGGGAYAVGLFSFATALNDTLDVRRDRSLYPERPLPSGRLSVDAAVALIAGTLLVAVLGAAVLGLPAVLMALFTTATILVHNTVPKFVPSVGLVSVGLIYGAHMMTPNPYLVFVWPVLLVMAHALLLGAFTHRLERKRPRLNRPVLAAALAGSGFWAAVLVYVGWMRADALWPEWVPLSAGLLPAALGMAFVAFAWNKARMTRSPRRGADKLRRYGALWVTLYGAGWMLGMGWMNEAMLLGGLALAGLLGMTILREVYGLIEHPVGYRH